MRKIMLSLCGLATIIVFVVFSSCSGDERAITRQDSIRKAEIKALKYSDSIKTIAINYLYDECYDLRKKTVSLNSRVWQLNSKITNVDDISNISNTKNVTNVRNVTNTKNVTNVKKTGTTVKSPPKKCKKNPRCTKKQKQKRLPKCKCLG
jgi:hypothetical protein